VTMQNVLFCISLFVNRIAACCKASGNLLAIRPARSSMIVHNAAMIALLSKHLPACIQTY